MSDFDRRMAQVLDDAVPEAPRTLNPAAIRAAQLIGEGRSRRIQAVLAVAAVILVVAGIVAVIAVLGGPSHPRHPPVAEGPQTSARPTMAGPALPGESPREITTHAVEHLLGAAPMPPGAEPSAHAPIAALRVPAFTPGEINFVRRTEWATAPGAVRDALDYFAAHLPTGFTQSGTGHSGGGGSRDVYSRTFDAGSGWRRPAVYTGLEISISAVRTRAGVAIRVDADAAWLTPRSPGSYVARPSGGTVVIRRDGFARTVRRTLTVAEAAALARLINDLHVPTSVEVSCPGMSLGHQDDLLTFRTRRGAVRVDVVADGCEPVTVHNGSVKQTLFGYVHGTSVNTLVLQLLGFPPEYGRR